MNTHPKIQVKAAQRLLLAVIQQAFKDYCRFARRGLIVNGRVKAHPRRRGQPSRRSRVERQECESLIQFFRAGGAVDALLKVARLGITGAATRSCLRRAAKKETRAQSHRKP